jgi:arylformamidase
LANYIDISVSVRPGLPVWPNSPPYEIERRLDIGRGDAVNDSTLRLGAHTGTHIDAPLHFFAGGAGVEDIPLDAMIGPAEVVSLPDVDEVTPETLESLALPRGIERLLIRTRNSRLWADEVGEFRTDFVALTPAAARWVVERGIRLVGMDYLSVQRYKDGPETHLTLLGAGVVVVEGLNMEHVKAGSYEMICLPLRLADAEGAPARVVLKTSGAAERK